MYAPFQIEITNFLSIEYAKRIYRRNQPTVIVGVNTTDSGQKSNGVGKSSLMDAQLLAITGSVARKVTLKELIKDGADKSIVNMMLYSVGGERKTLEIKRTLFANSSPQLIEIYLTKNGGQRVAIHDTLAPGEKENWILEELGIARSDIFDFFLITKEKSSLFLSASDQVKKTIINRFSGAEKIDQIKPFIEKDIAEYEDECRRIRDEISKVDGKILAYTEQLLQEKEKVNTQERIDKLLLAKKDLEEQLTDETLRINLLEDENIATQSEIDGLDEEEVDSKYKLIDDKIEGVISQQNALEKSILANTKEIGAIEFDCDTETDTLTVELRAIRTEQSELMGTKTNIEAQLKGFIECPKCTHEFSLSADFSKEEALEGMLEIDELLETFQQEITKISTDISALEVNRVSKTRALKESSAKFRDAQKDLAIKLTSLNKDRMLIDSEINKLRSKEAGLRGELRINNSSIDVAKRLIESCNNEIKNIDEKIEDINAGSEDDKVEEFTSIIDTLQMSREHLIAELGMVMGKKAKCEEWVIHFRNFKSYLANQSINDIQDYTNLYLQQFGSDLSISIEGYKVVGKKLKEEISIQVLRRGVPLGSYGRFSGGERGRIDMASILALQELINLNSHEGLDWIEVDELLESLDATGIESIMECLESVNKTVSLITQLEVNVRAENVLTVTKVNNSTILSAA